MARAPCWKFWDPFMGGHVRQFFGGSFLLELRTIASNSGDSPRAQRVVPFQRSSHIHINLAGLKTHK